MAKNAKLTIYHTRPIQARVKYSILLLQHRLKKITLFSESRVGGRDGGGRSEQCKCPVF